MIKVKHSRSKRALLLDFSGEIEKEDITLAVKYIQAALGDIGRGYTLIELFRDHPHFGTGVSLEAGSMAGACYEDNRIWRVIRIEETEHADPGMSILHRTRWQRAVPELTMNNIKEAVVVAKEEALEQAGWSEVSISNGSSPEA